MSKEKITGQPNKSREAAPSKELFEHQKSLEGQRHEKASKAQESSTRQRHEEVRATIEKEAISGKEQAPLAPEGSSQKDNHTRAEEKEHAFQATMHHVRRQLSPTEKALSKIIHQPAVEKISEVAGKTIARPSGITGAAIAAFLGLLGTYGIARQFGFALSGSEGPLLLASGFIAGLLVEWAIRSVRSVFGKNPLS